MNGCGQSRVGSANFPSARFRASTIVMTEQETLLARKKRGPAPTGKGQQVVVRMQPDRLAALDDWIAMQPDQPTRPEAVRRLLEKALR